MLENKTMSSTGKSDKWLLIQWTNGTLIVVNEASVISSTGEAKIGCLVIADKGDGTHGTATIIQIARDRQLLERQISSETEVADEEEEDEVGSSNNEEPKDYSASISSSWEPSDENLSSDDDDEEEQKKTKMERFGQTYTNKRNSIILKPVHRVDAFNIIMSKNRKRTISDKNRKEREKNNENFKKRSMPDSTKKNKTLDPNSNSDVLSINVRDIMDMKQCFFELFNILTELKSSTPNNNNDDMSLQFNRPPVQPIVKPEVNNTLYENTIEDDSNMSDRSEELNRSDDNVLINMTDKYDNTNKDIPAEKDNNLTEKLVEWIPIGSGKTLLQKDKYRKVNWKSYSVATRTLLLALFSRRILATHTLTGKRSAFKDKPVKMCLDPEIVIDVVIEITNRFKVKENLVRTIIGLKCNDESKWYMRQKKNQNRKFRKTMPEKQLSN